MELAEHLHFLKLLGDFFFLSCGDKLVGTCILMLQDNTTAIAYMGGKQMKLNALAKEIWGWCLVRQVWLSASHLPGVENIDESGHFTDRCEWA